MAAFHMNKRTRRQNRGIVIVAALLFIVLGTMIAGGFTFNWYQQNIMPLSDADEPIVVVIDPGATARDIAVLLEENNVIRSARAFDWYTRVNNARSNLQAGGYTFTASESVKEIVDRLRAGDIARDLFTILPAQRIDQIRTAFMQAGYTREEIMAGFDVRQYEDHPALAFKPQGATLEGYLYPESFQKSANTTVEDIIRASLDQTVSVLTPALRERLQKQGLTVHEAIILASIVEVEVPAESDDRPTVAQVYLKRLREGMRLEADPTAQYGTLFATGTQDGWRNYDTPYNTYLYEGLPPGPIANVSQSSLEAIANPSNTDFVFFVADDNKSEELV